MKTKVIIFLCLFVIGLGYSMFCFGAEHLARPGHARFCASFYHYEYVVEGIFSLVLVLITGSLVLLSPIFTPNRLISFLYKPPERVKMFDG